MRHQKTMLLDLSELFIQSLLGRQSMVVVKVATNLTTENY
jgi:hypothetical protein